MSLAGNHGQRIVDFVARTGGQLRQGTQLQSLEALRLAGALLVDSMVQRVDLAMQSIALGGPS